MREKIIKMFQENNEPKTAQEIIISINNKEQLQILQSINELVDEGILIMHVTEISSTNNESCRYSLKRYKSK